MNYGALSSAQSSAARRQNWDWNGGHLVGALIGCFSFHAWCTVPPSPILAKERPSVFLGSIFCLGEVIKTFCERLATHP